MKKRSRLILLILCAVLFFFIAPLALFYSQGYRFDFDEKKFVETGGLYIKVSNTPAEIYLDGKFIRKTGLLSNSILIKNLLPKKHNIEIKKEGFWSWQKTLEIEEKKVTKIENVLLIKKDISFKPLVAEDVEDFLVSQDGKKTLLRTEEENWSLEELSLENGVKRKILEGMEIIDWKWDSSKNRVLFQTNSGEKIAYFLLDYTPQIPILSELDFLDEETENISFNPKNDDEFFYLKNQIMFRAKFQNPPTGGKNEPQAFLNNIVTFKILENDIIWLSTSGFLFKSDYSGKTKEVLNQEPFFIQKEKKYKIETQGSEVFLLEAKRTSSSSSPSLSLRESSEAKRISSSSSPSLSLRESSVDDDIYYLSSNRVFQKIFDKAQGIKFSSDSKKAVYWNNYEIWILEFGIEYKKIFLTRFSKKIGDCFWLTPYYLIFNVEKEIKITEIDNRDKLNIVNLSSEKENNSNPVRGQEDLIKTQSEQASNGAKIFYNEFNKKLYLLNQEKLFSSEPVIP